MPIVFAIVVTFGLLRLVGHPFSFMSVTAIPLIIGIGIDNGIHLVRRYPGKCTRRSKNRPRDAALAA